MSQPKVTYVGPVVVSRQLKQKLIVNPTYSLKHLKVDLQVKIPKIEPLCESHPVTLRMGWKNWLRSMVIQEGASWQKRDVLGTALGGVGTGLRILNAVEQEVITSKLGSLGKDFLLLS